MQEIVKSRKWIHTVDKTRSTSDGAEIPIKNKNLSYVTLIQYDYKH